MEHPVSVRIPTDVKAWLKARAEVNDRTVHAEILHLLKTSKRSEDETAKAA